MTTLIDNSEDKPTITISPNSNGNMKEIMFRHLGTVDELGKRKLSYEKTIVLGLSPIVVGGAIWCSFKFGSAWTPNFFRALFDNLPLALPILTLLLSVLLSPQSVITRQGALRLSNPISLGLVNFAIWYLVTAQSANKFIKVNDHSVLNADYAVLVFIVAFMFAGFCSVITVLAETSLRRTTSWYFAQFVLLVISVASLALPIGLLQQRDAVEKQLGVSLDARSFTVVIPYRDPALNAHLGRIAEPIDETAIYRHITAKTISEAKSKALRQFKESELNDQYVPSKSKNKDPKPVEILEYGVIAQEESN